MPSIESPQSIAFPPCIYVFGVILTLVPNIGAWFLWFLVRRSGTTEWLQTLRFPSWKPHRCISGTIWLLVNSFIGYASYLCYREIGGYRGLHTGFAQVAFGLYAAQLVFNWGFIPLFFYRHKLHCSFFHMILLDITAITCGIVFSHINGMAGALFVPYSLWLLYNTAVSYVVYRDNYPAREQRLYNEQFMRPELVINNEMKK